MSTLAACFLIPLSVGIYVIVGGMRATLLCDYVHTTVRRVPLVAPPPLTACDRSSTLSSSPSCSPSCAHALRPGNCFLKRAQYVTSDLIGSPERMWQLLQEKSAQAPVEGNAEGSYVTMSSLGGGIFGVINVR
jgi:hypothetical protein